MKILFIASFYKPEGNALASRASGMAEIWAREGHDVTVIAPTPKLPSGEIYPGYKNLWRQQEEINGVHVIRRKAYLVPESSSLKKIVSHIVFMFFAFFTVLSVKKMDIIITSSPPFFPAWLDVPLHWLKKSIYIVEFRDPWVDGFALLGIKIPRIVTKILFWMERSMLKFADHVVAVGPGYKKRLLQKNVPEEKISIIMNGADEELFYPRERDVNFQRRFSLENKFVCSYIGTLGYCCGLFPLIPEAAKILKGKGRNDIVLMIIGDGKIKQALQDRVEAENLDNVRVTGILPKQEIPLAISCSDVSLVHLRENESFDVLMPSKIFENAAMRRPILIGVGGFAEEFVTSAQAGIPMVPESPDSLVEKIIELADHPEKCRELGHNAEVNIAKKHSRYSKAMDYLKLMNDLIEGDKTGDDL